MKSTYRCLFGLIFSFLPLFAFATTYPMPKPGNDIIGQIYDVKAEAGDTLASLGLRYGMSAHEMMEANHNMPYASKLRAGQTITVPAQFILPPIRQGIVINMSELRLYYFTPDGRYVMTYPVAMGRDQWRSPVVSTKVSWKEKEPVWHVPASIRQYKLETTGEVLPESIPPGPDNPLGHFALHLSAPGYLIHGNNDPTSIGKFVSSGCVRMKNADVEQLFGIVSVGTPVSIVHYPNKVGWFNGQLYMESQIPVQIADMESDLNMTTLDAAIAAATQNRPADVDVKTAQKVEKQHTGIPTLIGQSTTAAANIETQPPLALQEGASASRETAVTADNNDN